MIGKTILHYKILSKLGEGGMGVVYKAEDIKLERMVAIKFLPPHIAGNDEERKRFEVEAKAAASLNHNNIATIYNIEEIDDETFIVMEHIKGQELKDRIDAGPLPIEDTLNIAIQIAKGLQTAHANNVIHRDIKSANIMLTDEGDVKIMDFGLAKRSGKTRLTKEGTTLGTVAYMSPEQTRGNEVDHRTDIFSLGVLLYEMLTGQVPFKGEYDQAVTYSILNEDPEPVTSLRTGVPMELERIVNKCLEKDASDRYQQAEELIVDLRRLKRESEKKDIISGLESMPVQPTSKTKYRAFSSPRLFASIAFAFIILVSIAGYWLFSGKPQAVERVRILVVDTVNETNEANLGSLTGRFITAMEQSGYLDVMSGARIFDELKKMGFDSIPFVDEELGRAIAKQANVKALAIPNISRFGDIYNLDLTVIDPESGDHLFTAKEEGRGQESILAMIDRISAKTRIELKEEENVVQTASKVAVLTTSNFEAYQHYSQGMQLFYQGKWGDSERELKQAIAIDSTFGLAYVRLLMLTGYSHLQLDVNKTIRKAFEHIARIPERERYLLRAKEAVFSPGFYLDGELAAISILQEMEKVYPDDKDMLYLLGIYSSSDSMAIHYLEKVRAIDHKYSLAKIVLVRHYFNTGEFQNARVLILELIEGGNPFHYTRLAEFYALTGRFDEGVNYFMKAWEQDRDDFWIPHSLAGLYFLYDEFDEAEKVVAEAKNHDKSHWQFAELQALYIYTGRYRKALQVADQAIKWSLDNNEIGLAAQHLFKAMVLMFGWGDKDAALEQVKDAGRLEHPWNFTQAYGSILVGDYQGAEKASAEEGLQLDYELIALMDIQAGRCQKAIAAVDRFESKTGHPVIDPRLYIGRTLSYHLSFCYLEQRQPEKAIAALRRTQMKVRYYIPGRFWWRPFLYPKSFYGLGRAYELKGDTQLAIRNYEKFLDLWKDADEDLPDLIDAKKRLAKLKGGGVR